jgi:hypothetical protein
MINKILQEQRIPLPPPYDAAVTLRANPFAPELQNLLLERISVGILAYIQRSRSIITLSLNHSKRLFVVFDVFPTIKFQSDWFYYNL